MEIKKGLVIFGLILILLIFSVNIINAAVMHSSSDFLIKIDESVGTLKNAIEGNYFTDSHVYSQPSSILDPGHGADEIWVSVNGNENTLLQTLSTTGLCGSQTTTSYTGPSDKTKAYHYANEIETPLGKSFQDAIDNGDFCAPPIPPAPTCDSHDSVQCYDNDEYWYDSCGNREEMKRDCWYDYCAEWWCETPKNSWEHRSCYRNGCSGDSCYSERYSESRTNDRCSGKVICTELYNLGILDEETYKMDIEYASKHFSPEALRGYRAWAIPVVKAMRKNPEAMEFIIPMVNSFMEEIAYRVGKKETGNEVGAIFLDEGVPLFERIGVLINEPDWRSLFDESWLENWVDPIYNAVKFATGNNLFSTENIIRSALQSNNEDNKYDELVKSYFTEEKVKEMFYDALERGNESDVAFAHALIENLEEAVEEIESMVRAIEDNSD